MAVEFMLKLPLEQVCSLEYFRRGGILTRVRVSLRWKWLWSKSAL